MNDWIWLAMMEGVGPVRKKRLLEKFKTPRNIYEAKKEELLKVEGISEKIADSILKTKDLELIKKYEAYMNQNHIKMVNIDDKEYPEKLKQIYDPPITLFCIGNTMLFNRISIGIVGSRSPSLYGVEIAKKFSKELSEKRNCSGEWACQGNRFM